MNAVGGDDALLPDVRSLYCLAAWLATDLVFLWVCVCGEGDVCGGDVVGVDRYCSGESFNRECVRVRPCICVRVCPCVFGSQQDRCRQRSIVLDAVLA